MAHDQRTHALLSASGASRWLACTPSARLEESAGFKGESVYAKEGTLAHELAELSLRLKLGLITEKVYGKEYKSKKANTLYTEDMDEQVAKYVDYVLDCYTDAKRLNPGAIILLEQRLDYSHVVEDGYGTGDVCIISDGVLKVIDLKYGLGIPVSAFDNPQLKLYGIGALRVYDMAYDINALELVIVQPRLDSISTFEITVEELSTWAEEEVRPKAALASKGEGDFCAGSWCKFCKVKAVCRTFADLTFEAAKLDFKPPQLLSIEELTALYGAAAVLQDWLTSVEEYLLSKALKGEQVPGFKIVEGKSTRSWGDEIKVAETLTAAKIPATEFTTTSLLSVAKMEKAKGLPKGFFTEKLSSLVHKPAGAPTLVPVSDPRPVYTYRSAEEDFAQ